MSKFISSVSITFAPRDGQGHFPVPLSTLVITTDAVVGSTIPQVIAYLSKNPLVKSHRSRFVVVNLTFQYSTL